MNKILFINACVRRDSRTLSLARELLSRLEGEVYEERLELLELRPLTGSTLERRDALLQGGALNESSFAWARRFAQADSIVLAAPYWDCSFPASVKVYIEHIMVNGITFTYTPEGFPQGLCRGKRLYCVSTAGGPVGGHHLGFDYIRTLAGLYWGIPEVELFLAENLDIVGADTQKLLKDAADEIRRKFPLPTEAL